MEDYRAHGGLKGLTRALALGPAAIVAEVTASGLRGRGGAGFPTVVKWKTVADATGARKFIVANADEGDSGTFADRMLMEGDLLDRTATERMRPARRQAGFDQRGDVVDRDRSIADPAGGRVHLDQRLQPI